MFETIDPTTGTPLQRWELHSPSQIKAALNSAARAFPHWRMVPTAQRAQRVQHLDMVLSQHAEELAIMAAREMGKPVRQGRAEIAKCAAACRYYAERAEEFLADQPIATEFLRSCVVHEPLGPILGIMPWNFPFWQVIRFAIPAVTAGNTVVLKHATNVPGCAALLENSFHAAGFPDGVFISIRTDNIGAARIIRSPAIKGVSLTGSTAAGKSVAAVAGKALKPTVLELGGSDPYLILEDADLDLAAQACAEGRLVNSGQSCIAAKRFIVVDQVRVDFEKRLTQLMEAAVLGSPLVEATEIGPQARHDLRDLLHSQVIRSVSRGAKILTGGAVPTGMGAFYPPTLLTDVSPGMPAYSEELFGPVGAIIPVRDEAAAIQVANATSFGLGAAVFTRDIHRGERIASRELAAGCCFVNAQVRSDPRLPFGGIYDSGYGRELARDGVIAFVNRKTVVVA